MRLVSSVLLAVLIVAGCATRANYEKILNTWIGASADRLVQRWGAPARTFRLPRGNEIYIYDWRYSSVYTTPTQVQKAPGTVVGNRYYPGHTTDTGAALVPNDRPSGP